MVVHRENTGLQSAEIRERLAQLRLVVFDWDGTLEDSTSSIVDAIERTLKSIGRTPPSKPALRSIIGLNAVEGLARLYPGEDAHELARLCAQANTAPGRESRLYPGVQNALMQLVDNGLWLAVATGKHRAGLDQALERHGLGALFLTTRTANDAPSKPHPSMLESILDELGVEAHEALMVGDTTFDLQMATNAGVASVGVSCGSHSGALLQSTGLALHIIDGVHGLPSLLDCPSGQQTTVP